MTIWYARCKGFYLQVFTRKNNLGSVYNLSKLLYNLGGGGYNENYPIIPWLIEISLGGGEGCKKQKKEKKNQKKKNRKSSSPAPLISPLTTKA